MNQGKKIWAAKNGNFLIFKLKKKFELKEKGHEPSRAENTSARLGLITTIQDQNSNTQWDHGLSELAFGFSNIQISC